MDVLTWLHLFLIEFIFYKLAVSDQVTGKFKSIVGCEQDHILPAKAFLVISAKSHLDCATICARTIGCYSFNTCPDGKIVSCSLIGSFQTTGCAELQYKEKCKHREHTNAAALEAANPCCNGAYYNGTCVCIWGFAGPNCCRLIRSCREGYQLGIRGQGFYDIQPFGTHETFNVWCNCDWVGTVYVFKRTIPPPAGCTPISYDRTWQEYKDGFGDINCEYFLGLEILYKLTQYANYQLNIYNVISQYSAAASIYMEGFTMKSEASNYEVDFVRIFTHPWEHGDDAFDASQKPRQFCTRDRDCGGCAGSVGAGWWFTSTCEGGAITAPPDQMVWPVNSVDKVIDQSFIQIDLVSYV